MILIEYYFWNWFLEFPNFLSKIIVYYSRQVFRYGTFILFCWQLVMKVGKVPTWQLKKKHFHTKIFSLSF